MPKVTITIPSYNHEKYVAQAIQSVLNQTYQDFEIVITDDGSTDGTVKEIQKFIDPRIRLFCFGKNQGASVAINNCIHEAKGEYIAPLCSDDIFLPSKLEMQVAFLDNHPEIGAVFGYAQIIDDDGNDFSDATHYYLGIFKKENRNRFKWLNYFFLHGNALCHPSALLRKECYEKLGGYDERMASQPDFDFWVRLCMRYDIYVIPSNLIKFRIRHGEENASGNRPEFRIRCATEFIFALRNFLRLTDKEDFFKVFPNAQQYEENFDSELVPFYLANFALAKCQGIYSNFAIECLFNLLEDSEVRQKLYTLYAFSATDFIRLTGECDLFNVELARKVVIEPAATGRLKNIRTRRAWRIFDSFLNRDNGR